LNIRTALIISLTWQHDSSNNKYKANTILLIGN